MTRRRTNPVVDTSIDIQYGLLEVQKDVTIAMDELEINSLQFLSTISLHIYFRTMNYMPNTTVGYYQWALNNLNSVYKRGGFNLNKIYVIMNFTQCCIQSWRHTIHQSRLSTLISKIKFWKQREKINILKNIFARSIADYHLTDYHMKLLSTWDSNWLGSQICFRQSTVFRNITARVWLFAKKIWIMKSISKFLSLLMCCPTTNPTPQIRIHQVIWTTFICELQIALSEVTSSSTYRLTPPLHAIV